MSDIAENRLHAGKILNTPAKKVYFFLPISQSSVVI